MRLGVAWVAVLCLSGCSIRSLAVNKMADALASGTTSVFASDEDPELVRDALPFALKTLEALLEEKPDHTGLLLSTCQGFLLYGAGFVEFEADRLEATNYREAKRQHERALKLYLRARGYCLRALDLRYSGASQTLVRSPEDALADARVEDVPLLYWTAGAWGSSIAAGLDRPELLADLPAVRALVERALDLDSDYNRGALYEAMMRVEIAGVMSGVGSIEQARQHFERALELSGGRRANLFVAWAEKVSVQDQNRQEFEAMLDDALAVDPDRDPEDRLMNVVGRQRAQWLLDQIDDLFLGDLDELGTLEDSDS